MGIGSCQLQILARPPALVVGKQLMWSAAVNVTVLTSGCKGQTWGGMHDFQKGRLIAFDYLPPHPLSAFAYSLVEHN